MDQFSLLKPTLNTPYHIEFDWWKNNDRNWRVLLLSYLAKEHQALLSNNEKEQFIDIVDQNTAEVLQVDALQHLLMNEYAHKEGFISSSTPLTEAIFRLFLTNGNFPLTAMEIGNKLGRPASLILQTLSGKNIHQGIKPSHK